MINLAALFVLSPSRSSSASSRCLQARPNPSVHPAPSTTPPPAFRHPAKCFTLLCPHVQRSAGRQSSATFWRQTLSPGAACCVLVHCCVCAVSWCSNGTMQCLCCVLVAAAAGAAKRVQEGLSLLLYSFVSSFQVVLCEQRCACGQVANRMGSLALARFGRGYRQNENETNVRHSVRSETPKVRHS